jgi:hypothetical protein
VKIDKNAPVTKATYPAGWNNTDAVVTLEASDNESGVKNTLYRVDGGIWVSGNKLTINASGIHTVEFYSVDNVKNIESTQAIQVKIDKIPPKTSVGLAGTQWPDGSYKTDVTITLSAVDNPGGYGVAHIYYRIGATGSYTLYQKPIVVSSNGSYELYVYSDDNCKNTEVMQRFVFKIIKPWPLNYSLLCKQLTIYGNLNVDRVFSDGPVNIYGHCRLNYLGTTARSVLRTGPSTIDTLLLNQPYQAIPQPDWNGLKTVTTLRKENQIPQNTTLSNVWFHNSLMIAGTTKLSGIIVVKGDLVINGNLTLDNVGIFCSGTITFNGNVNGSGLIYAGTALIAHGNPQISGGIIVNGPVEASGTIGNRGVEIEKYLIWLH